MPREDFGHDAPEGERTGILGGLVRLNRYLLVLLIIPAGLIYFWPPFKERDAAQERLQALVQERDVLKEKTTRFQQKLELIKNDPDYLEAMARDRLHLQKDGEVILRFDDKTAKQ